MWQWAVVVVVSCLIDSVQTPPRRAPTDTQTERQTSTQPLPHVNTNHHRQITEETIPHLPSPNNCFQTGTSYCYHHLVNKDGLYKCTQDISSNDKRHSDIISSWCDPGKWKRKKKFCDMSFAAFNPNPNRDPIPNLSVLEGASVPEEGKCPVTIRDMSMK